MSSVITLAVFVPTGRRSRCFSVAYGSLAFTAASIWSLPADVAPSPAHVASIGGIQNFASNLAGVLVTTTHRPDARPVRPLVRGAPDALRRALPGRCPHLRPGRQARGTPAPLRFRFPSRFRFRFRRNARVTDTTTAAVLHGPKDIRIEPREVPAARPGEVLVRVRAVGLCGSDLHYYAHGENGPNVLRTPTALGHEAAGVVVATGDGASAHPVGTAVAVEPAIPCGRCRVCRAGRYNQCSHGHCFGSPPTDGALTRFLAVPEEFAHPVPEGLPFASAALVEPLAVAVHAIRRGGVTAGDRVLVTGAGPIGLLVLQAARAVGADEVTVTDVNADRLAHARRLGAARVRDTSREPLPPGQVFDVLLDCSGVESALADGARVAAPRGHGGRRRQSVRAPDHAAAGLDAAPGTEPGHRLPLRGGRLPRGRGPGRRRPDRPGFPGHRTVPAGAR